MSSIQPDRFHKLVKQDIKKADLLLIMGTSLQVQPVSLIPEVSLPSIIYQLR
jgi:NAD-dependent SIR2 family protein deacetylase